MKRIIQFSGGLCSYFAASRVIEKFGREGVTLLFADTLIESRGLYRFALHAVARLGVPFALTCDGRTPFEVFRDEKFLGNTRVDLCSRILKRERCRKWMEENCDPADSILYVGISWDEGRMDEISERWLPWKVEAPMCDAPYWTKCDMMREAERLKLPVSPAYYDGFPHDNCGGGCVKAGISQFVHLRQVRPEVFETWKQDEASTIKEIGKEVAILRDRRGGETKPMTLGELETRIIANDQTLPKYEWGGCGCGV